MKMDGKLLWVARRGALQGFALVLNSKMARQALVRSYIQGGLSAEVAAERVALERVIARRRTITGALALLAVGVVLNNAPQHSFVHRAAAAMIYAALFVLASQLSDKWIVRPGQVWKALRRR